MDNIAPSKIDPAELPAGFSAIDPNAGVQQQQHAEQQQKQVAVEQQRESVLEQALTADALARLRRIKMVKEQKAKSVENAIVNMALSGKLAGPISDEKLVEMLERGNAASSSGKMNATSRNGGGGGGGGGGPGSIQIQRKNYGKMDSDDDDDNDDDL